MAILLEEQGIALKERREKIDSLLTHFRGERLKCLDWRLAKATDDIRTAIIHCQEAKKLIDQYDEVITFLMVEHEGYNGRE